MIKFRLLFGIWIGKRSFGLLAGLMYLLPVLYPVYSQDGMKSPDEFYGRIPVKQQSQDVMPPAKLFSGFVRFFQTVISPLDGPRSPSYPTGSAYGFQAVQRYGVFMGSFITADRLYHETDYYQGPFIRIHGKARYLDPLEFNTYWWDSSAD